MQDLANTTCHFFSNVRCVTEIIPFHHPTQVKLVFIEITVLLLVMTVNLQQQKRKFDMYSGEKQNIYGKKRFQPFFYDITVINKSSSVLTGFLNFPNSVSYR